MDAELKRASDVKAVKLARELKKFLRSNICNLLQSQQTRRVASQDALLGFFRNVERLNAFQHLGNAADLVRIVAACQDVIDPGKRDG